MGHVGRRVCTTEPAWGRSVESDPASCALTARCTADVVFSGTACLDMQRASVTDRHSVQRRSLHHQPTTTPPYLTHPRKIGRRSPAHKDRRYRPVHRRSRSIDPPAHPQFPRLCPRNLLRHRNQVHTIASSRLPYRANIRLMLLALLQFQESTPLTAHRLPPMSSTISRSSHPPSSRMATPCAPSSCPRNCAPSSCHAPHITRA